MQLQHFVEINLGSLEFGHRQSQARAAQVSARIVGSIADRLREIGLGVGMPAQRRQRHAAAVDGSGIARFPGDGAAKIDQGPIGLADMQIGEAAIVISDGQLRIGGNGMGVVNDRTFGLTQFQQGRRPAAISGRQIGVARDQMRAAGKFQMRIAALRAGSKIIGRGGISQTTGHRGQQTDREQLSHVRNIPSCRFGSVRRALNTTWEPESVAMLAKLPCGWQNIVQLQRAITV